MPANYYKTVRDQVARILGTVAGLTVLKGHRAAEECSAFPCACYTIVSGITNTETTRRNVQTITVDIIVHAKPTTAAQSDEVAEETDIAIREAFLDDQGTGGARAASADFLMWDRLIDTVQYEATDDNYAGTVLRVRAHVQHLL